MRSELAITLVLSLVLAGPAGAAEQPCDRVTEAYLNGWRIRVTDKCDCFIWWMRPKPGGPGVIGDARYRYTADFCLAARHAGAIGAKGGVVTFWKAPGCTRFAGSRRNGVTSRGSAKPAPWTIVFTWPAPACRR